MKTIVVTLATAIALLTAVPASAQTTSDIWRLQEAELGIPRTGTGPGATWGGRSIPTWGGGSIPAWGWGSIPAWGWGSIPAWGGLSPRPHLSPNANFAVTGGQSVGIGMSGAGTFGLYAHMDPNYGNDRNGHSPPGTLGWGSIPAWGWSHLPAWGWSNVPAWGMGPTTPWAALPGFPIGPMFPSHRNFAGQNVASGTWPQPLFAVAPVGYTAVPCTINSVTLLAQSADDCAAVGGEMAQ